MKLDLDFEQAIADRIQENISTKQLLLSDRNYLSAVGGVSAEIIKAFYNGRKVLLFGNGGSAADAQHLAAEFTGRYLLERPGLAAMALTANTSSITAIGNDYSYDMVFARQLQALGAKGDVAIGITTSGNSKNVLCAMEIARAKEIITVGFTGETGGKLQGVVDYCIRIPSRQTPRIQEAHILTGHIICEIVESELVEKGHFSR